MAHGQPAPILEPAAFAAELERISAAVASGPPGVVPDVRVPPVWRVEADGQRFEVPAGWLEQEIGAARRAPSQWPSKRSALLARLTALQGEAEAFATAASGPPLRSSDSSRQRASAPKARNEAGKSS